MAFTAQNIVDAVAIQLQDTENLRWPLAPDLLTFLNEGVRNLAYNVPSISQARTTVTPVAGAYQTLPAGGLHLTDVIRNSTGDTITQVNRDALDDFLPSWYQMSQQAAVIHYALDDMNSKAYWVYPPNNGAGSIEITYHAIPTALTALSSTITLDDTTFTPLVDWLAYRVLSREDETSMPETAAAFKKNFDEWVAGRATFDKGYSQLKG